MIENENPVIADSLWNATANPAPNCPPLFGEAETDVAVIGGGWTSQRQPLVGYQRRPKKKPP